MAKELEPLWGGIVTVIAFLYGIWAAANAYVSDPTLHKGPGILLMFILVPIVFFFVMGIAAYSLGWILVWAKGIGLRICLVLVAFGIFFSGYGKPSFVVIIIAAIIFPMAYFSYEDAQVDADDLEDFLGK